MWPTKGVAVFKGSPIRYNKAVLRVGITDFFLICALRPFNEYFPCFKLVGVNRNFR